MWSAVVIYSTPWHDSKHFTKVNWCMYVSLIGMILLYGIIARPRYIGNEYSSGGYSVRSSWWGWNGTTHPRNKGQMVVLFNTRFLALTPNQHVKHIVYWNMLNRITILKRRCKLYQNVLIWNQCAQWWGFCRCNNVSIELRYFECASKPVYHFYLSISFLPAEIRGIFFVSIIHTWRGRKIWMRGNAGICLLLNMCNNKHNCAVRYVYKLLVEIGHPKYSYVYPSINVKPDCAFDSIMKNYCRQKLSI